MVTLANPDLVEQALSFDPLQTAEDICGEGEAAMAAGMLLAMMHSKSKTEILKEACDTHNRMSFQDFENLLQSHGFETVLKEDFDYDANHGYRQEQDIRNEQMLVMFHQHGMLVRADSYYNKTSVNSGDCYFSWKPHNTENNAWPACNHISGGFDPPPGVSRSDPFSAEWTFHGHVDVREGLIHNLAGIRSNGRFINPWTTTRGWLPLTNYADWKLAKNDKHEVEMDYIRKVSRARAEKLPKHVIDCIGRCDGFILP